MSVHFRNLNAFPELESGTVLFIICTIYRKVVSNLTDSPSSTDVPVLLLNQPIEEKGTAPILNILLAGVHFPNFAS